MNNDHSLEFRTISGQVRNSALQRVETLLNTCDLDLNDKIEHFVVVFNGQQVVACAGLDQNVIKCVAIDPAYRSENLGCKLMGEIVRLAGDQGHFHLFLYSKSSDVDFFRSCGFYPLITIPEKITLMENTPVGISHYVKSLSLMRKPGERIGAIVMNADPFTLGHRYLVEQAALASDWLHLFVIQKEDSEFSLADRLEMVQQGVAEIENVMVHEGLFYMLSQATFPTSLIKEKDKVPQLCAAMNSLLFCQYVAPALGITHWFAGTEPIYSKTKKSNQHMQHGLQNAASEKQTVAFVELERITAPSGELISSSAVREAWNRNDFDFIAALVPHTTLQFLENKAEEFKPNDPPALFH